MRSVQIGKCYEKVCPHNFINLKALFLLKYFFFLSVHANNTIQRSYILFCKVFKQKVLKWLLLLQSHFLTYFYFKDGLQKSLDGFSDRWPGTRSSVWIVHFPHWISKKDWTHIFLLYHIILWLLRKSSTIWTIISFRKFYRNIL